MTKAKEKAIEYCRKHHLIVPFFSKKDNKVFGEALDIAIQETEKEYEEKIKEISKRC